MPQRASVVQINPSANEPRNMMSPGRGSTRRHCRASGERPKPVLDERVVLDAAALAGIPEAEADDLNNADGAEG